MPAPQALGEGWLEAIHPADREAIRQSWAAAVQERRPVGGDYRFLHPDGRVVWVHGLATPDFDAAGHCLGWIGTITDVTPRVEAETLLATQRDVLEMVVSGAPLVATLDLLLRSLEGGDDRPLCSILILDPDRLHIRTLAAPHLPPGYTAAIDGEPIGPAAGSCGTAAWLGMEVISEDIATDPRWESYRDIALSHGLRACWSTPIFDRDGVVLGTFAMYYRTPHRPTDTHRRLIAAVTDLAALAIIRDREMRALLEREQQFRALFEQAGVGVAILLANGNYSRVNPRFCELLGVTPDEVLGQPIGLFSTSADSASHRATFAALIGGEVPVHRGEYRIQRPDGTHLLVRATASVVRNADGTVDHVVLMLEDVTVTRQLERQLQESQKIEAIGILAGGVAHDFNNLLSVVLGHAQLAFDELPSDHPVREDLTAIAQASRHGAEITRQLLAFARRELGPPQPVDVNARITELRGMLGRLLREEINFELDLAPDLWPVLLDPTQLDQALINLVNNSRDAIRGSGTVCIDTANVQHDGDWVRIRVHDTGSGMDSETLDKVFEPFFTTKPRGVGTGLGLSVVVGVVEKAGGQVTVDSTPGVGTVFTLLLPRSDRLPSETAGPSAAAGTVAAASRPATVLVVEDEPALLRLTARTLDRGGYTVLSAGGPREALALLANHPGPIDLLVSDVVMPGMSGPELAEQIRAIRPGIAVMFMSGYPADVVTAEGRLPESSDYLQKPFTSSDLVERVERTLRKGRREGHRTQ